MLPVIGTTSMMGMSRMISMISMTSMLGRAGLTDMISVMSTTGMNSTRLAIRSISDAWYLKSFITYQLGESEAVEPDVLDWMLDFEKVAMMGDAEHMAQALEELSDTV